MEHLLRLAHSNGAFLAAVLLLALGVILWLAWARFFPDTEGLERASHFLMALSLLVVLAGCYAWVATKGLDGVACAAGRHSLHRICYSHDERPGVFWLIVGWQTYFFTFLMVVASVLVVRLAMPGKPGRVPARQLRRVDHADAALSPVRKAKRGGTLVLLVFATAGIALVTLAWIAKSLDQVNDLRERVAEAFASVAPERSAVEAYLQDHGRLPENNQAVALPPPASLQGHGLSQVEVVKGSLLLTFDAATADKHLAGRHVLLVALRDGRQVQWHCAMMDVDDRYLPLHCAANL